MLDVYRAFAEEDLAIPVIAGRKSENEKFAGALRTYSIEAMMGDGKALQSGTSHNLGTNFAKVFEIEYLDADGQRKNCATTSWGLSTRVIGAIIMVHGDKSGLILPPRVAPYQVVIVPIWRKEADKVAVNELVARIEKMLKGKVRVKVDISENTPGWKFNEWEMRGVPVRMEVGPRDVQNKSVVLVRRDNRAKEIVPVDALEARLPVLLEEVQQGLFQRALKFREDNTYYTESYEEFKQIIAEKRGFVRVKWAEDSGAELAIKEETKATLRVIPFDQPVGGVERSEEHTSELQSRQYLVCRLLLEKKKKKTHNNQIIKHTTNYNISTSMYIKQYFQDVSHEVSNGCSHLTMLSTERITTQQLGLSPN